ncbi:MAG: HD domain-containing protein [Dehalococcoidales bacterium]|nr:HD domain-containing protein [Dehalococcoidales bacterium]
MFWLRKTRELKDRTINTKSIINRKDIEAGALDILFRVCRVFQDENIRAYLVGGFIRDTWISRPSSDIDIAVKGDALIIGERLASHLHGRFVPLDAENLIGRIILPNSSYYLDISSFVGDIESDLARRDFTINALAVDLSEFYQENTTYQVIDEHGGMDDLDHGIIRAVSDTTPAADPIRLLRAVRLAAELGFTIEHHTENLIKKSADLLLFTAGERIREELLILLDISKGGVYLKYMDELGLLTAIIPEMELTKGVTQPVEHYWNVFEHSLMTVTAVDYILGNGVWDYADDRILSEVPWSVETAAYFEKPVGSGSTRRTLLKLAALLHDVSKPQTKTIEGTGKMRFLGHNELGSQVSVSILERLRFSAKEINLVANVVKYHLRPNQMGQPPSRRAVYRYFRDVGDAGLDALYINLADHLATRGPNLILPNWRLHTGIIRHIMEECARQTVAIKPERLVDGNDLRNIFGLQPGPFMGELIENVREAQATGELTNRQAALDYIRKLLLTEGKK